MSSWPNPSGAAAGASEDMAPGKDTLGVPAGAGAVLLAVKMDPSQPGS